MIVSRWLLLALALARAQRRPSSSELLHGLLGENIAEKLDTSQSAQLDVPRTARAAAAGASSGVSARQLASALTLEELEERAEGDTQQAFLLAIRYYHGDGVPTDRARAWSLWENAAALGHPASLYNLGLREYDALGGETISADAARAGRPRDAAKAARYFRDAAERGLPQAQFHLGAMHAAGAGVPRDAALARDWYARAAESGLPAAVEKLSALSDEDDARALRRAALAVLLVGGALVVGWPAMTRPPLAAIAATAHDDGDRGDGSGAYGENASSGDGGGSGGGGDVGGGGLDFRSAMYGTLYPDEGDVQEKYDLLVFAGIGVSLIVLLASAPIYLVDYF